MAFCCRRFCGNFFIFKDDMHHHTVDKCSRESKTDNKIFSTTWPTRSPDLTVTESVCLAIKLSNILKQM